MDSGAPGQQRLSTRALPMTSTPLGIWQSRKLSVQPYARHPFDAGFHIRALVRNANNANALALRQAVAELVIGDLRDRELLRPPFATYGVLSVQPS